MGIEEGDFKHEWARIFPNGEGMGNGGGRAGGLPARELRDRYFVVMNCEKGVGVRVVRSFGP